MIINRIKNEINSILKKDVIFPENKEILNLFKGCSKSYILGSSPSINKLNLTNLRKDKNALIITIGNFHEHLEIEKIKPSIHIFAASHPPITKKVLINWWTRCDEVLPENTPLLIEKRDYPIAKEVFKNRKVYKYSYGGNYPIDFTKKIISPWSVTLIALQLAIYCQSKNIYFLGIDHDWQCIKPYLHFYDHSKPSLEYYLKNENIKIPYEHQKQPFPKERLYREYELYQQYERMKEEANKLNINIYNADPYSHFDVYEKRILKELII